MRRLGTIIVATFCVGFAVTPARAWRSAELRRSPMPASDGLFTPTSSTLSRPCLKLSTDLVDLRHELKEKPHVDGVCKLQYVGKGSGLTLPTTSRRRWRAATILTLKLAWNAVAGAGKRRLDAVAGPNDKRLTRAKARGKNKDKDKDKDKPQGQSTDEPKSPAQPQPN
jgi:hypothetical protein